MAEPTPPPVPQRIEDLTIEQELQDSYLTYAMSTIMDRALPDVRDGLKPSQRRILVAMNDLNLRPGSKHLKCAKIAGNTSGDYHPHGESIVYPTLVRLAQPWSLRYPLIDGQGNFGSTDGDPPAAMRYTEARPTSVEQELMLDLNLDTVDFQPNYDERLMEPTVLPGRFPNLLVNGSTGIAVGMACNLLPHNLREICDAIIKVINEPEVTLPELLEIVPGPDFPTGGVICGRDGIIDGYKSGRGRITLRAKIHVEENKGSRTLVVIDEIPYGVIRKSICEAVGDWAKKDQFKDVSAINDESGREHAVRIVLDLKRDGDPNVVINQLYQYTSCQITVPMINIALVNRQPRTMGLKELIEHFVDHRKEVITRRTKFLLRRAQQKQHILEGQIFAICDIDEVIRLIRSSKTREEAIDKLMQQGFRIDPRGPLAAKFPERITLRHPEIFAIEPGGIAPPFRVSRAQAEHIGRLQLIQLVGLELEKLIEDYNTTAEEIEEYERILGDAAYLLDIIREDVYEMKEKYGDDRRTEITGSVTDVSMEDLIAKEDVIVTVSHGGYVKRQTPDNYRSQSRGGRGIKGAESKEGDFVEHLFVANTHDYLLFFTNQGRVYERRVFDVPEGSRTSQGRSVANLLAFQPNEKVANVLAIKDFTQGEHFLMFATAKGTVKKTALSAYDNIRTNGIIAIGLEEGDSLIDVAVTSGKDHVLLGTKSGLAIRFEESDVRAMGRPAGGVTGARFKREGDAVVAMLIIHGGDSTNHKLLTACLNGFGKRTPLAEYPVKGRGTRGVINIDANERNGDVVGMKLVADTDEVMLITEQGIMMRTRVSEIRETGRNAQGVRLMRLDDGDRLVAMACVAAEEAAKVEGEVVEGEAPANPANTEDGASSQDTGSEEKSEPNEGDGASGINDEP
ncbi:MAG TPA: DNA gyrase subunit A [Tepidisphaeraceae bacterium]|jgi:DNA gyrase subunit A|nr:DNA gyrase subunit A [Tepidisphaeraceae bacterium]